MEHIHLYRHGFRRHNIAQVLLWNQVLQVLATSLSCMRRAAVRVCPLGVFLYAYILHQCF